LVQLFKIDMEHVLLDGMFTRVADLKTNLKVILS